MINPLLLIVSDLPAGAGLMRGDLPGIPAADSNIQTHLLKQQHQIEHEMLLRQFHEQQIRLQQEQEKQMQDHIQVQVIPRQHSSQNKIATILQTAFSSAFY